MTDAGLGTILAADILQLAVVAVGITLFVYVRAVCGPQARFVAHLGLAYAGVAIFYVWDIARQIYDHTAESDMNKGMAEAIGSTFSLVNTAFFITAWYLMRDLRLERSVETQDPQPTMSKNFVTRLIAALMTAIALYIGMMHDVIDPSDPNRPTIMSMLFMGVDALLAMGALFFIASELAQLPVIRDADEGSLFPTRGIHLLFRVITVLLFVLLGITQWRRLLWVGTGESWPSLCPHTGLWYQCSAMLKALCSGAAAILALHALPSVRWKHRPPGRPRSGG